jgi:hypothetical protein
VIYPAIHGLKISAPLSAKKQAIVLIRTPYAMLKYFLQPSYKPADATQQDSLVPGNIMRKASQRTLLALYSAGLKPKRASQKELFQVGDSLNRAHSYWSRSSFAGMRQHPVDATGID